MPEEEKENLKEIMKEMQDLQEEIEKSRMDKAMSVGRLSSSLDRLKKEYGYNSIESADKEIKKNKLELTSLKEKITEKFNKLKLEYEW